MGSKFDQIINDPGDAIAEMKNYMDNIFASIASGVPVHVASRDSAEVFARARLVRNTVELDPDAPTLNEVREMIDEVMREAEDM